MRRIARQLPASCCLLLVVIPQLPIAAQCTPDLCVPAVKPHAAVVRVAQVAPGGSRCYGSGTLVHKDGKQGIVLTCAHLFRGGTGDVTVTFPDGRRFAADLAAMDQAWDLAALRITQPEAMPVTIAADHPEPGDPLQSCGYGPDGRYWCNRGRVLGYVRTAATKTYETLELSGRARDGDSGGPVFNASGELVAVLWGTDGRIVGGTYCGRIRKFLGGIFSPQVAPQQQPDSTPPAPGPSPSESSPPLLADHLDKIRQRLDGLAGELDNTKRQQAEREQSWAERMKKIENAVALVAGLKDRVEKAEEAVGGDNLRAVVREVAAGIITERAPGLAQTILPAVLAALGWTGPPSVAAILAIRLVAAVLKRRVVKRRPRAAARTGTRPTRSKPLNDDYARQLARVYALSGRSPTADATLGREYDAELQRAEQSSDAALSRWARALRERVARKFYRIHDDSPLPSEPADG